MDYSRYARQMMLRGWGEEGQKRLEKANVVVVGLGGLGSSCAIYLAVAGVGHLRLVDKDIVELSNLNRQILHWDRDIGKSKVLSAWEKLKELNGDIEVQPYPVELSEENIEEILQGADVVIDCLDDFPTRFLLNSVCVRRGLPLVHSAVFGLEGRITTIIPGKTPCLRCLYPQEPIKAEPFPVVGVAPGIMGCLEALEAIKLILTLGEPLLGRMLRLDGARARVQIFEVKRDPHCPLCGSLHRE